MSKQQQCEVGTSGAAQAPELPDKLRRWLDTVSQDVEGCMYDLADPMCNPEKTAEARRNGVKGADNIRAAVADDCYNDEGLIADLCADKISDAFINAGEMFGHGKYKIPTDDMWNAACRYVADRFSHLPGLYDLLKRG